MNCFKIISPNNGPINYLYILKDGRLVVCFESGILNVYNPKDNYSLEISIQIHRKDISNIIELSNSNLVTSSWDSTLKIIEINQEKYKILQSLEGHESYIDKVINPYENLLISISEDQFFKTWEKDLNTNKYICTNTIRFQEAHSYCNILKIKNNEFITSSVIERKIKFWNLENLKEIKTIENISTNWSSQNMILINEKLLMIGGSNFEGFYLINIITRQLMIIIKGPSRIYSIIKSMDDNFICGLSNQNGIPSIQIFKYYADNINIIYEEKNAHNDRIFSVVQFDNGIIASASEDTVIKLWSLV